MHRIPLLGAALLAVPVAAAWWLLAGLLAGDDSACADSAWAEAAFYGSWAGLALALGALIAGAVEPRRERVGWALLALYVVLLGTSVLVFLTCE
jgi:hypothetical protein